ncbi:MAG: hypothetical protein DKINENOH_05638 [bacterium]|nr:hypothetical protein [bacterium]
MGVRRVVRAAGRLLLSPGLGQGPLLMRLEVFFAGFFILPGGLALLQERVYGWPGYSSPVRPALSALRPMKNTQFSRYGQARRKICGARHMRASLPELTKPASDDVISFSRLRRSLRKQLRLHFLARVTKRGAEDIRQYFDRHAKLCPHRRPGRDMEIVRTPLNTSTHIPP